MMKNPSKTLRYCNYSFEDLYKAAYGKSLDLKEKERLQHLAQGKINLIVKKWAQKAGWKTEKIKSTTNTVFIAFQP